MPLQTATNPQTGERVAFVGGEWKPITQSATNKEGTKAYLVGDEWVVDERAPTAEPKQAAAPAPTAEKEPTPSVGDPMGADLGSAIMNAPETAAPTGGSIFERGVKMEPPPVDYRKNYEAMARSGVPDSVMYKYGREYEAAQTLAERGKYAQEKAAAAKAAKRQQQKQAAASEDYGFTDFAADTGLDLSKGVIGLGEAYVGLLDITSGGAAGRVLGSMGYDPERTTKFLNGLQSLTRQNARASVEEAKGFVNTLQALAVNPTELVGSIAESLPGTVLSGATGGQYVRFLAERAAKEAAARNLVGKAATDFIRDKIVQQTGKIALVAGASEGAQTSGQIAEQARQMGRDWSDYVEPAIAAGLGTTALSALSGKLGAKMGLGDVETAIAARSAGVKGVGVNKAGAAKAILGDMAKEGFLEELPQSAQEQIFTNIATGRPWDEGVSEAGAKGLATGAGMGGGHAAVQKAKAKVGEIVEKKLAEYDAKGYKPYTDEGRAELIARSKGFLTPEYREKVRTEAAPETSGLGNVGEVRPGEEQKEEVAAPEVAMPAGIPEGFKSEQREQQIASRMEAMVQVGIPEDDARKMAEAEVAAAEQTQATRVPKVEAPADRVAQLTQEFIDAGYAPDEARTQAAQQAQEEAHADELAQGEADVARPVTSTSGTSVSVAGQPGAVAPARGAGVADTSGVVPAGQDVAGTEAGAAEQPAALIEGETPEEYRQKLAGDIAPENINYQGETPVAEGEAAPAAEAPKGKRGRPAVLTEEERQQRAEGKKPGQAAKAKADRAIIRLTNTLEETSKPLDAGEFESEDAYNEALDERRKQRRVALRELMLMQTDPMLRGTKVGARLKAALAHASITPKERADVQAGISSQRTEGPSASTTSGKDAADTRFSKFTNGAQALSHIIKTGTEFQKLLGKRLRGFVNGVNFVVIEVGDPLPAQLAKPKNAKAWERSIALYVENYKTGERTIYVRGDSFGRAQGINNTTILHELLHAATNRKLAIAFEHLKNGVYLNTPAVKAAQDLLRTMRSAWDTAKYMRAQGTLSKEMMVLTVSGDIFDDPREFVAYGMTDPEMQAFLMKAHGFENDTPFFTRFVTAIRDLFGMGEDTTNAMTDLIVVTDKLLSARMPEAAIKGTSVSPSAMSEEDEAAAEEAVRSQKEVDRAVKEASAKFQESLKGEEYAKGVSVLQAVQDPAKVIPYLQSLWSSATEAQRKALVRIPTTEFLADWAANVVPELKNTDRLMQSMAGMTQQLLHSAGQLTREIDHAYRADPTLEAKMSEIAHLSTLSEVDPSNPNAKERSAALDKMYAELGPRGQELFKRVKTHFENLSQYFSHLLDEQITNSGLPIVEQANLMKKIRAMYETGAKISPYFPLVRRGDYWLSIGSGKGRKFFMYESAQERDNAMRGFAAEQVLRKPGESDSAYAKRVSDKVEELATDQEYTFGNDIGTLRRGTVDSSEMLKGIFGVIDGLTGSSTMTPEAKEGLKDAVYQIYLQTMPEQSFRKQFIHRKGYAGFSTDFLRNVATATTKMSTQLARLKYARQLRLSLSQARDSIVNQPQYEPYVAEMERRVYDLLSSKPPSTAERIVGALNKASFIWYLGGAASALLQPLSIFQTGMPVLVSRYGTGRAMKEMSRMLKVWEQYGYYETNADGTKSWVAPSIEHAKGLTPDERRAVRAMLGSDVTTSTYASEALDYKNTPSGKRSSGPITRFGKNTVDALVLGGLMHSTERLSREVMFLTSYRLNRKTGKNHEQAIAQAVVDTNESLGNYGQYNRPSFMKGAAGKFLTQFMMYPLHVTLFLLKNFKEMIKPMNGRTRQEAVMKFFGTLGTTFILAGAAGLPMFSTVMGLLGYAWDKFKDDEWDDELRKMSFEFWFRTVWLDQQLGETRIGGKKLSDIVDRGPVNALTGLDISGRTSLNNLWFRDTKESKTVRDSAMQLAMEKAGPTANMVLSWAEAYQAFMQGDYDKGVNRALPAGFRNFKTAYDLYQEGAKDNKGARILSRDAFTTGELIGQAVGFRSDLLANTQYVTFKVIGLEQRIQNERQQILNNMDREYSKGNAEAYAKYYREMEKFNATHPSYAITTDNLVDSLERKGQQRAESFRGVGLTEKNVPVFAQALAPSRRTASEREQQNRK